MADISKISDRNIGKQILLNFNQFWFNFNMKWSTVIIGKHGWCSSKSTRLSPLWPGFNPRNHCHMWVEFVVDSLPCFEGFSLGSPVFLPPQKQAFLNSDSIMDRGPQVYVAITYYPRKTKTRKLFIHAFGNCNTSWKLVHADKLSILGTF
jgi:hypothetical protein